MKSASKLILLLKIVAVILFIGLFPVIFWWWSKPLALILSLIVIILPVDKSWETILGVSLIFLIIGFFYWNWGIGVKNGYDYAVGFPWMIWASSLIGVSLLVHARTKSMWAVLLFGIVWTIACYFTAGNPMPDLNFIPSIGNGSGGSQGISDPGSSPFPGK